jgi:hypothetical protein
VATVIWQNGDMVDIIVVTTHKCTQYIKLGYMKNSLIYLNTSEGLVINMAEVHDALVVTCPCDTHRYFINHKEFKFSDTDEVLEYKCSKCKKSVSIYGYRKLILTSGGGTHYKYTCKTCGAISIREYFSIQNCRDCRGPARNITVEMNIGVTEIEYTRESIYRPWKGDI